MFGFLENKKFKEVEDFFSVISGEGNDAKVFVKSQKTTLLRILKENKNSTIGLISTQLAASSLFNLHMHLVSALEADFSMAKVFSLELKQPIYVAVLICGRIVVRAEAHVHCSEMDLYKEHSRLADFLQMRSPTGEEISWREWIELPPDDLIKSLT